MQKKAVILFSGGLDSTTCLALAQADGFACYALSIDYGQRHIQELIAASLIAQRFSVAEHRIMPLNLALFGGSALTDLSLAVPDYQTTTSIPITYVPARNTIFLSIALAYAEVLGANDIFLGINAVDYSNYPDCRPEFLSAFQIMANLATRAANINLHAPLLDLSKAEIITRGISLGVDYSLTVSCYSLSTTGAACGRCDSCMLRQQGFQAAGIKDPTHYVD